MQVSARTIGQLKAFVTGDNQLTVYRSGPALVRLFNEYGSNDAYPMGGGFPSRHVYAEEKIRALNGTPDLTRLIEEIFDPLEFEGTDKSVQEAVTNLNPYLERDGYRLVVVDGIAKVMGASAPPPEFAPEFFPSSNAIDPSSMAFVLENADKCRRKLKEGDYRGAITNARSLMEDVLVGIEKRLDPEAPKYNGDLTKLSKRVRKLLKMEAEQYRAGDDLFVMLNGLTGVVDGLAGFSNRGSDRHAGSVQPARHHAFLIVNAAVSICSFMSDSADLQLGIKK